MQPFINLVKEYRGDTLDLLRFGYLSVVDERSNVIFSAGDPDAVVFYRSSSKPLQALPVFARSLDEKYGITPEESTIFAASHMGEEYHVAAMESIFNKAGFSEDMLVMKPCAPTLPSANEARLIKNLPKRKFYHNCSGKHASLMLVQREMGGKAEDYWKLDAPVQKVVIDAIEAMSECKIKAVGVDGCGVPVFAVPIKNFATAYKNLACLDTIEDEALRSAAAKLAPRMNEYPHMISGTNKICTLLNMDENLIAKGGANGVYGLSLKKQRVGIALKVLDGTENPWPLILMETLRALDALPAETEERLMSLRPNTILNDNDTVVGHSELAFGIKIG